MKFIVAAIIYVFTYNPYNTQEELGLLSEYEDDINKLTEITNCINNAPTKLLSEENILFLTVLYQNSLKRDLEEGFYDAKSWIKYQAEKCVYEGDCDFLMYKITRRVEELKINIKHLKDPANRIQDLTFNEEFNRAGKKVLATLYDSIAIISVANEEEFKSKFQQIEVGASLMIMDHSGNRLFGMPINKFISILASKQPNEILLGICRADLVVDKIKEKLPKTTVVFSDADQWKGFNLTKEGYGGIFPEGYIKI